MEPSAPKAWTQCPRCDKVWEVDARLSFTAAPHPEPELERRRKYLLYEGAGIICVDCGKQLPAEGKAERKREDEKWKADVRRTWDLIGERNRVLLAFGYSEGRISRIEEGILWAHKQLREPDAKLHQRQRDEIRQLRQRKKLRELWFRFKGPNARPPKVEYRVTAPRKRDGWERQLYKLKDGYPYPLLICEPPPPPDRRAVLTLLTVRLFRDLEEARCSIRERRSRVAWLLRQDGLEDDVNDERIKTRLRRSRAPQGG